jgi:glycosyltransferase involved in cell wall biosynthesis
VGWLLRPLLNQVTDVKLAPSKQAAAYTFGKRSIKGGTVVLLHNGLALEEYSYRAEARAEIRKALEIGANQTVIGHVGRFNTQKNHLFLLQVFRQVLEQEPNAILLLVGDGELRESVDESVRQYGLGAHVRMTGVRQDIPALLSAMDVFALPSLYEGMPNVIIEAQASGLPCVLSDRVTREADLTGLVEFLPLNQPRKWAEALLQCAHTPRMDVTHRLKEHRYDIDSVTKRFIQVVFEDVP